MKSLAARGLIESRTQTGIRVLDPMHWNLLDFEVLNWRYSTMPPHQFYGELFEIRQMIEPQAAALAAARATAGEIAIIAEAFGAMTEASPVDASAAEADLLFHRSILAAGHNALLLQTGQFDRGRTLHRPQDISRSPSPCSCPCTSWCSTASRAAIPPKARHAMERLLSETLEFMNGRLKANG